MAMSLSRLSSVRWAILARSAGIATHLGCRRKGMEIELSDAHLLLSRYGKPGSQKYELMKRLLNRNETVELYNIWAREELPMVYQGDKKEAYKRILTCEKALKLLLERNPELRSSAITLNPKRILTCEKALKLLLERNPELQSSSITLNPKRILTRDEKALKLLLERNPELHSSSIAMQSSSKSPAEEVPPRRFPPSVMRCYLRPDYDEDGNIIYDEEGHPVTVRVMDGTILS